MNIMKSMLKLCSFTALASIAAISSHSLAASEDLEDNEVEETIEVAHRQWYELKMKLYVPRIYDNTQSLGKRKYQRQHIRGYMSLDYSREGYLVGASFVSLENKTHRMSNGRNVTYDGYLDESRPLCMSAIGSNKSGKFKTASICFSLMAEPSYNVGAFDEDTSLFVTLAGKGTIRDGSVKIASGAVAGTLGCGCYAYGHISPTRILWWYGVSSLVTDVAAVHGSWKAKRLGRQ